MAKSSLSISYYAFTALHFACFALAITVCGLYGANLQRTKNFDNYTKSKWVSYLYLFSPCRTKMESSSGGLIMME